MGLLEKVLMLSTLVELSILLDLLTIQIPSLNLRLRRSRTAVSLCSPCSDSTFRLFLPVRDLLRTGLSTSLIHPELTVSPSLPQLSSPLRFALRYITYCDKEGYSIPV